MFNSKYHQVALGYALVSCILPWAFVVPTQATSGRVPILESACREAESKRAASQACIPTNRPSLAAAFPNALC